MHHADGERAPEAHVPVPVFVVAVVMRDGFPGVRMKMKVMRALAVPVNMKVGSLPAHFINHVGAEQDDHAADGEFENRLDASRNRCAEQQQDAADHEQRNRVAEAPGAAS